MLCSNIVLTHQNDQRCSNFHLCRPQDQDQESWDAVCPIPRGSSDGAWTRMGQDEDAAHQNVRPEQSNLPPNLSFTAKDSKYKVYDQIPFFGALKRRALPFFSRKCHNANCLFPTPALLIESRAQGMRKRAFYIKSPAEDKAPGRPPLGG